MRNVTIAGNTRAVVIVGPRAPKKKIFCWFGLNEAKNFEAGTITAESIVEAKEILVKNKRKGVFNLKEVTLEKEFVSLGTYIV